MTFFAAVLHFVAFLCGFGHEIGCVFWVHESERRHAWRATGWSALCGAVGVVGVWLSIEDLHHAPALILGYAAGTNVGIRIKGRLA